MKHFTGEGGGEGGGEEFRSFLEYLVGVVKKMVEDSAPLSGMGSSEDRKREMNAFMVWRLVVVVLVDKFEF